MHAHDEQEMKVLADWYDRAAKAGFVFLRMKGGFNFPPPKGWNKQPFEEWGKVTRDPDVAVGWLAKGYGVAVGCGDGTCIVDCDDGDSEMAVATHIDDDLAEEAKAAGRWNEVEQTQGPFKGQTLQVLDVRPSCLRVMTPRGAQYFFSGPRAGALPQTQGAKGIPHVDTRAAWKGYGMGPGSFRVAESYGKKKAPPDDSGGPWHYSPGPDRRGPSDIPQSLVDALFPEGGGGVERKPLTLPVNDGKDEAPAPAKRARRANAGGGEALRLSSLEQAEEWLEGQADEGNGRNGPSYRACLSLANSGVLSRETQGEVADWLEGVLTRLRPGEDRDTGKEARRSVSRALAYVADHPKQASARPGGERKGKDRTEPEFDPKVRAWLEKKGMLRDGLAVVPYTPRGYELALSYLGIGFRFEARRKQVEVRGACLKVDRETHGLRPGVEDWIGIDSSMGSFIRDLVGRYAAWEKVDKRTQEVELIPMRLKPETWREWIGALLHTRREDGFRLWLDRLPKWDGKHRLDTLLADLFYLDPASGADEVDLQAWASASALTTAVARTYDPGRKIDEVPVLIGPQGCGKTAFAAYLLPDEGRDVWYTDSVEFSASPKVQLEGMKGRVIVEFGEMVGLTKADLGRVKAFITRLDDGAIRMAYRSDPEQTPRMAAFILTTNVEAALPNDETGNRRFVVVRFDPDREEARVPVEAFLEEHREQLWAEAKHRILVDGEDPRLPRHLHHVQKAGNERHRFRDAPVEDSITEALPNGVAYPGLTLEQIALLTDFTLKTKHWDSEREEERPEYKPWSQVVNREGNRLRQALQSAGEGEVVWKQSDKKVMVRPETSAYRWYTTNKDAPEAGPFRAAAMLRKHYVGAVGRSAEADRAAVVEQGEHAAAIARKEGEGTLH